MLITRKAGSQTRIKCHHWITFLSAFIANVSIAQWESDIRLTDNLSHKSTSFNAQTVAANGNNVYVVWTDFRNGQEIFYKYSTDGGTNWSIDLQLTNGSSKNPSISVSGSFIHVVYQGVRGSTSNSNIYYKQSVDGGISWGPEVQLSSILAKGEDPVVSSSESNVFVAWSDFRDVYPGSAGGGQIYHQYSTNNGISWVGEKQITNNDPSVASSEHVSVSLTEEIIHVSWSTWTSSDGSNIYYSRSTNGGVSWQTQTKISNNHTDYSSTISVSNSIVHVLWASSGPSPIGKYYRRSIDGGINWGSETKLTNYYIGAGEKLTVAGSNVYAVWLGSGLESEIYFKHSFNSGNSWESELKLTADDGKTSYSPSIAVSGSIVHVVWVDSRDGNIELYYKRHLGAESNNWLGFYNSIENNNNFLPMLLDSSSSGTLDKPIIKICADGSKATEVKFKYGGVDLNDIKFRLQSNNSIYNLDLNGSFDNGYIINGDTIKARLTHPKYVLGTDISRKDTIEIFNIATQEILYKNPIIIYRAPVLMVHGLWSCRSAFEIMENSLTNSMYPPTPALTWRADYSDNDNDSKGFETNKDVVPNNINILFSIARSKNFSAGKVIVVGHSMGGILSRVYLQCDKYRNDIQKLITINTPHAGTQAANLILDFPSLGKIIAKLAGVFSDCIDAENCSTCGAVKDLAVNSDAMNLLNGESRKRNPTPSHAISTVAPSKILPHSYGNSINSWDYVFTQLIKSLIKWSLYSCEKNDWIVPLSSQNGATESDPPIENQGHNGSCSNATIISHVKNLVMRNPHDQAQFLQNGFDPPSLCYGLSCCLTVSSAKQKEISMEQTAALDLLLKAMPNPGTEFFEIKIKSDSTRQKISLKIFDLKGRAIETRNNLNADQTLQIGHNYKPGIYIAEIMQGNRRNVVKLVKL